MTRRERTLQASVTRVLAGAALAGLVGWSFPVMAQSGCELKIGSMGPMSGGAAQWGLAMDGAARMAAAEVNVEGGLKVGGQSCHVTVVAYDSKYTADGAAAGSNALAAEGIHFIIGPVGSPEATGIKPILGRNQQIAWNASYAKDALATRYPLMFHISPGPGGWADAVIKEALKHWTIKSVALIAPNDQGGTDIVSVDDVAYKDNGITTTSEYYQRGTTNFAPIITRVLAANPDAVDTASSPPGDAGVIVKQLRLAGFKGPIGRNGGPGTEEILRVSGGMDVLKDFYWYNGAVDTPKTHAIDADYKKLLGKDQSYGSSLWVDLPAARMTLQAISAAGTIDDVQKVAEAMRHLPVDDPNMGKGVWSGQKQFGLAQELMFPFGIGIIKDGKDLGVTTVEPKL